MTTEITPIPNVEHYHPELNATHKQNLLQLADRLEEIAKLEKQHFHMAVYIADENIDSPEQCAVETYRQHFFNECGTTACALGHAAIAGIGKPCENFIDYEEQFTAMDYNAFVWLFTSEWYAVDNTPQGAALRIRYMLKHGIPTQNRPWDHSCYRDQYQHLLNFLQEQATASQLSVD